MSRALERVLPARLGTSFRWLLASSWTSNTGDGLALAAGPLLVARLTGSPFVVALAATAQWLPPLLFALPAGVLTDRLNRRTLVVAVSLVRAVVLGVLVTAVATGAVSVVVVLAALFALTIAEVFADNAAATLLPDLVDRDDLVVGNARLQFGFITLNQLAGPPIGAALFAVGAAWPFAAQAVLTLAAAALVAKVVLPVRAPRVVVGVRHDLLEGLRWTWRHANVRTLVVTIFAFNVTFGAAWSVLVLYATQRLGLGPVGYGLVATVIAAGGLIGTLAYGRITRLVSLGTIMRIGLVVETFTHLSLALTTTPWVAMIVFAAFGAHGFIWQTTSITVRQRAVPSGLQGRVNALNTVGTYGGLVIGSAVGGVLAAAFGIVAPFWFAFAGSALLVVLLWRSLTQIAHDDAAPAADRVLGDQSAAIEAGS